MIPSAPRCKLCTSPFGAPGGPILRLVGKGRWPGNPLRLDLKGKSEATDVLVLDPTVELSGTA